VLCDKQSNFKFATMYKLVGKTIQIDTAKLAGRLAGSSSISSVGILSYSGDKSTSGRNWLRSEKRVMSVSQRQYDKKNLRCFACQGFGHLARECKAKAMGSWEDCSRGIVANPARKKSRYGLVTGGANYMDQNTFGGYVEKSVNSIQCSSDGCKTAEEGKENVSTLGDRYLVNWNPHFPSLSDFKLTSMEKCKQVPKEWLLKIGESF
jgi:Zinc knuckle